MDSFTAACIVILALVCFFGGWAVIIGYENWQTGLAYDRDIGGFYEYADRGSDAKTKADDFNKYIDALRAENLTSGPNSVFYQNQPTSMLENDFKTALSLQSRLNALAMMDQNSMQYQMGLSEINTEFCWYPTQAFEQAYFIHHGMWGAALWPVSQENSCQSSSSHNSS